MGSRQVERSSAEPVIGKPLSKWYSDNRGQNAASMRSLNNIVLKLMRFWIHPNALPYYDDLMGHSICGKIWGRTLAAPAAWKNLAGVCRFSLLMWISHPMFAFSKVWMFNYKKNAIAIFHGQWMEHRPHWGYQKGTSGQLGQWFELFDRPTGTRRVQKSQVNLRSLPRNLLVRTVISN